VALTDETATFAGREHGNEETGSRCRSHIQ